MSAPFACELAHSYNPATKAWQTHSKITLEAGEAARVLLRQISDRAWRTLCFVALRIEPTGRCFVTADDLARDMGITRAQAAKRLEELAQLDWGGNKVLSCDGEGYTLTTLSGNPPLLDARLLATVETESNNVSKAEDIPSTQDLIRELTRKLHKIPGVQPQKGNYSLVGRALNTYGYEAVSAAIEDLYYEFDLREQLGKPVPTNGELAKLLMQRSDWNKKSIESEAKGGNKESIWDYYGWNERGDQLVPIVPDPPFTAKVIGGKIVIGTKTEGVEV